MVPEKGGNIMKKGISFYESLFLGFGYTFMLIVGVSLTIFIASVPDSSENPSPFTMIGIVALLVVLPTIIWILYIHRGFSKITINQSGLSKSLFKIFYKKSLFWEEIIDVKVLSLIEDRIYFSRIEIIGMPHRKLVNHKDIIHVPLTKEICQTISTLANKKFKIIDEYLRENR